MTSHDIVRVVLLVCLTLVSGMAFALVAYWLHGLMEIIKMGHAEHMNAKNKDD